MTHLWMRAETRADEARAPLTPQGAASLLAEGLSITVERAGDRIFPDAVYAEAGCAMADPGGWTDAPADAIILGLKELPASDTSLRHHHIFFGHAFKEQPDAAHLLGRFRAGGGALLDLEYLTDAQGRRQAAFGYWAGYAGAAVTLLCWAAQLAGRIAGPVTAWNDAADMRAQVSDALAQHPDQTDALVIGAHGRVGRGVADLLDAMGLPVTKWDISETAHGGPFPEVLDHALFFNCILAQPGAQVFVPETPRLAPRRLRVIGDIACDPRSAYSPVKVYDRETTWSEPAIRVHDSPPLDVMAIDNLPSLLPRESSEDFAAQLLPLLRTLPDGDIWQRAHATFEDHAPNR